MVENGCFCGNFLGSFPQKVIGFALIWRMFLTKKEGNLPIFVTIIIIIIASLQQVNSPYSQDKFQICSTDVYLVLTISF